MTSPTCEKKCRLDVPEVLMPSEWTRGKVRICQLAYPEGGFITEHR